MTSNEFAVSVHGMLRMHAHIQHKTIKIKSVYNHWTGLNWTGLDYWTPSRIENSALFYRAYT